MTKHWQIDNDSNGVRWLSLDKTNSSANVLSQEVLEELGVLINQIEIDKPNGVVIRSAKSSGFILGADISEFTHIETTEQAETFVKKVFAGQQSITGHDLEESYKRKEINVAL